MDKNGNVVHTSVAVSPILDAQNNHISNLALITDITERKKAERKLLESYQFMNELVKKRTAKLEETIDDLNTEIEKHKKTSLALQTIYRSIANTKGEKLIDASLIELSKTVGAKYAFLGQKTDTNSIQILSIFENGKSAIPFEYNLKDTPCQNVVDKEFCFYQNDVAKQFPEYELLSEMNISSYMGVPVFTPNAESFGLIVLMNDKPMVYNNHLRTTIQTIASRIGAEIQQIEYLTEVKRLNEDLEEIVEERTKKLIEEINERTKTEKELKKSNTKWLSLINNSPDVIVILNSAYQVVFANRNFHNSKEIKKGTSWFDIIPKEYHENTHKIFSEVAKSNKTQSSDIELITPDKREKYWLNNRYVFLISGDMSDSFMVISSDISKRKKAEQLIIDERDKAQNYLDVAEVVILTLNRDGNIKMINRFGCEAFELPENEIVGKNMIEHFVVDQHKQIAKEYFNQLFEQEKSSGTTTEFNIIAGTAIEKNTEWRIAVLNKDSKQQKELLCSGVDITDKRNAEKHIIEREENFRNLFNNNRDIICLTDCDGHIIEINNEFCRQKKQKRDSFLGIHIEDLIILQEGKKFDDIVNEVRKNGKFIFEGKFQSSQKNLLPLEFIATSIQFYEANVMMLMGRDITERKHMQRKILRAIIDTEEKERTRFARDLHDGLGAILSGINIYLNMILEEELKPDEQYDIIKQVKDLSKEASESARSIATNLKPADISHFGLVFSLRELCEKIGKTGKIDIKLNATDKKNNLNSDIEIVAYRIVSELINNTLKHSGARNININIEKINKELIIQYIDDGKGFDVKKQLKSGKGNGLSNIVSRLQSISGNIDIKSIPGQGVKVDISIPVDTTKM